MMITLTKSNGARITISDDTLRDVFQRSAGLALIAAALATDEGEDPTGDLAAADYAGRVVAWIDDVSCYAEVRETIAHGEED